MNENQLRITLALSLLAAIPASGQGIITTMAGNVQGSCGAVTDGAPAAFYVNGTLCK